MISLETLRWECCPVHHCYLHVVLAMPYGNMAKTAFNIFWIGLN